MRGRTRRAGSGADGVATYQSICAHYKCTPVVGGRHATVSPILPPGGSAAGLMRQWSPLPPAGRPHQPAGKFLLVVNSGSCREPCLIAQALCLTRCAAQAGSSDDVTLFMARHSILLGLGIKPFPKVVQCYYFTRMWRRMSNF